MRKAWLVGLAALLVGTSVGCTTVSQSMQAWVGHHYSELIAAWGPPDRVFSDGRDGQIFIYTHTTTWVRPATTTTTYQGDVTHGQASGQATTVYTPEIIENYTTYRMFWIGQDGIIYSWAYRSRG